MELRRADLDAAVGAGLIEAAQAAPLGPVLDTRPGFRAPHILYCLGGLVRADP